MNVPLPVPPVRRKPEVELIAEDGIPMETSWHRYAMNLLIEQINVVFADREDYYVGGNMFIYFSEEQARNRDFRGPDVFFVWGASRRPERDFWVCWEENLTPSVIIELTSPSTAVEDRTTKFAVYERTLRTPEYFIYDPETHRPEGWRLRRGRYRRIEPNDDGWLWSEELELWLGTWDGPFQQIPDQWPRFFDTDRKLVPTFAEAAAEETRRAGKAAAEAQAESDRQVKRAEEAQAEADRQSKRAEEAATELERLRAELDRLKGQPPRT